MKKILLSLVIIFLTGCSSQPSNEIREEKVENAPSWLADCSCVPAGESYGPMPPESSCEPACCEGLTARAAPAPSLKDSYCLAETGGVQCMPCGNGICEEEYGETYCRCPEDCTEVKLNWGDSVE